MSKPFDASLKDLLEVGPADRPPLVHVKARSVEIIDADISTVTAATDKVLLVHAEEGDRIQHFDFQSGPKTTLPRRTHTYNALLEIGTICRWTVSSCCWLGELTCQGSMDCMSAAGRGRRRITCGSATG